LLYIVGLTVVLAVLTASVADGPARQVSYTEFKQLIRTGMIAAVTIDQERIRGTLKDGDQRIVAIRLEDPGLVNELEAHRVAATGAIARNWWTSLSWLLPAVLLVLFWSATLSRAGPMQGAAAFGRSRAKVYVETDVKITFADVAGIDDATEELREIVDFLQKPKKYTDLGGRIPKGVLLVGPPGTGKTLLARAVAGEARVPFFSLTGSEFVEMFVGVGAARVRDLFAQADGKAPCIIFIDELDAIGKVRGVATVGGGHEEREQTLNQLLAEMDGFDPRKGIVVMSATNRPEVLDPALLRPGRFDRRVVVDRPDVKGREAILRLHARSVKLAAEVDLKVVAARTTGFAGADLANLVNEATLLAARRDRREVTASDFEEAIDRVLAGLKRKRVMSPREREIVAAHEAGHAVVASVLPGVDPVHKISIVQRGYDALGHTQQLPQEDRYLRTRRELVNQLAVWLGGRAAEQLTFQEISTGGHHDLRRASDMARAMVTEYGMSETVGPVATSGPEPAPFLQTPAQQVKTLAEETAREIDIEVKRLMTDAYATALSVLGERRGSLAEISRLLLDREVVEGDEIRRLLSRGTSQSADAA
jgi:cell division protease FtsH